MDDLVSHTLVLLALRLVQPGKLADIAEGMSRISPKPQEFWSRKAEIVKIINELREAELLCLYRGQRYLLTKAGRDLLEETGIKVKIDERRMFLLKETRKAMQSERSGTRDRSLKQ